MMRNDKRADRIAGATLIAVSVGIVLAMALHPTRLGDTANIMRVHAILDLLAIGAAYGLFHMALRRGVDRPAVLAGCVFYAVALVANLGATVVNGFVLPQLADAGGDLTGLLRSARAIDQTLAAMGVIGTGAAFLLWSLGLLRDGPRAAALVGGFGIVVGTAPALLLAAGELRLDKHGALLVYAAQAGWMALIGGMLWTGQDWAKAAPEGTAAPPG